MPHSSLKTLFTDRIYNRSLLVSNSFTSPPSRATVEPVSRPFTPEYILDSE